MISHAPRIAVFLLLGFALSACESAAKRTMRNSPDYKAAEAIGSKYATFHRYAVEGLPQ